MNFSLSAPANSPGRLSSAAIRLDLSALGTFADNNNLLEKAREVRGVLVLVDEMIKDQFDEDSLIMALAKSIDYEISSRSMSPHQAKVLADARRTIALRKKVQGLAVSVDTTGRPKPAAPSSAKQRCPHCGLRSCRARTAGGCQNYCSRHAQCSVRCQAAFAARRPAAQNR